MKRLTAIALAVSFFAASDARAAGFTDFGQDIEATPEPGVALEADFRARGELLHNLDLDRGLTPSGAPLYPIPIADPTQQTLRHADMRLRSDIAAYTPLVDGALKMRLDIFDNLPLGSTPQGPPQSTTSQRAVEVVRIKRLYGEVLTPFGLLAVGRMGSHWGLGMLTNAGDCADCETGDAADRVAFIMPLLHHLWAVAYDIGWSGPQVTRPSGQRVVDLDPSDDVRSVSFAVMRYHTDRGVMRRLDAGRASLNYGMLFSYRWQEYDVPASYLPVADSVGLSSDQVVRRGLTAFASDLWVRLVFPLGHIELEGALIRGEIDEPSLIPGVSYGEPVTSLQYGAALETFFGRREWPLGAGVDAGYASGDAAYGFGATPGPFDPAPQQGDIDGPQANVPFDNSVDNFRFHPDYHVDQILFREIIGTVTDAVYVRPHLGWRIAQLGPGAFRATLAAIASWAVEPTSTPGGARPLGVEVDPQLAYTAHDTFELALQHGVLFPLAGLDNPQAGMRARPAQLFRMRMLLRF